MRTSALIGFGDADSFYSSAEAVRRPWLVGLPVGVLGNQGACVIARSLAMKKCGVRVGEPIWEAKTKCPDGVYVKRDFKWYECLSRRMLTEVGFFAEAVEYYSIDEFFWTGAPLAKKSYEQTAAAVRDHIKAATGLPMTVAYARTRTLAKVAAETAKPFGAVALETPDQERELLARLSVTEIPGIAARRAARLAPYGIRTCLDLARASGRLVKSVLTKTGYELWCELNGERVTPIRPNRVRHKMLARGGSLAGRVRDRDTLHGWLVRNVERLIEELQFHEVRPATLSVFVAYFDDAPGCGTVRLDVPSDRFAAILQAANVGLARAWRPGRVATHLHVVASDLRRQQAWQQSLFDSPDPKAEAIAAVKRQVNERVGRWKLRSGATLWANDFYSDPSNTFEICDVRGKFCF